MTISFLADYVKNSKTPALNDFVNSNLESVIAISNKFESKTPDLLFAWWRQEFALELKRQHKDSQLVQKKITYNKRIWVEIKNASTTLVHTRLRYHTEGLQALADTATSSRRILSLANSFADDIDNPIETTSSDSITHDTDQRVNTIIDNGSFLSPGGDAACITEHRELELHRLTYKKIINGETLTEKETTFLKNLKDDGESIKGALQQSVASKLLSDHLSSLEEEGVKLHLSGIINLIHPDMSKAVLSSLPDHLKRKLDYTTKITHLDFGTMSYIERILEFDSDIDGILEYIMITKAALICDHKRNTPQYINLAVIEQIVNNLCNWSTKYNESEATFYRRFASILDILLADTDVVVADGETCLHSSKVAIAMNKAIFHTGDLSQTYGRKIDMILKCSTTIKVDISSNEWKKAMVGKAIKQHQQSKNLRLNTCNLFSLNAEYGVKYTIAVDFVGNSGYLYLLRLVNDGPGPNDYVAIAHAITDLAIPTKIEALDSLKDTLQGLLTLKDHLVTITRKVKTQISKAEHAALLEDICQTSSTRSSLSKSPFIFFTPKGNRKQKRKFCELDEDGSDNDDQLAL